MTSIKDDKSGLDELFDELFPIARSITGPGIRSSLEILCKYIPFRVHEIPTGTMIGGWTIPQEWNLKRATLTHELGEVILDTQDSNLHVLNFSIPFQGVVTREELQDHLYSLPQLPAVIPYVTSYYEPRWGFCIQHNLRENLPPGKYEVRIDTELKNGFLNFATCDLIGQSNQIINLATYLCHPSLANNELSGPLAMVYLYKKLSLIQNRRFSYRFVVAPETIGSIAYLNVNQDFLRSQMRGGLVLTCLGGDSKSLSFKFSRMHWVGQPSEFDEFIAYWAKHHSEMQTRDFSPTNGSDERHYCSPHLNLPMVQVAKTIYGEYEGYHNSLDTKDFMSIESVLDSSKKILDLLIGFELACRIPISLTKVGEPQLGKHGLYPTLNFAGKSDANSLYPAEKQEFLNRLLEVISLADGSMNLTQIGTFLQIPWINLLSIVEILEENNLIAWKESV